jgi:hypothetical protein
MDLLPTDAIGAPARWLICFQRGATLWWVNLIPGRYKHVRAFSFAPECDCWVFYDPCLRTAVTLARGSMARQMMVEWARDSSVLALTAGARQRVRFLPFCCTTAIASLLGLPGGALRPSALYRQCLRHGAQIVDGAVPTPIAARRPAPDR